MLREEGYTVLSAVNGAEAIEIWEDFSSKIDLLVTDLVMPEMGGLELAQVCRGHRSDLPIIFMSGFTEAASSKSEMFTETETFLEKPFKRDAFLDKVRNALIGKPSVSA